MTEATTSTEEAACPCPGRHGPPTDHLWVEVQAPTERYTRCFGCWDIVKPEEHPNYWADSHPEGGCSCRVCWSCFRPRRPDQYRIGADGRCTTCAA